MLLLRIIIIDDEPHYLLVTKEIMLIHDREMDIVTSSSPNEALEWIRENKPDCVISDYKMPEMNGIEFTRRLRESSQVPVILYTNQSMEHVVDEAFEAGVSDYVKKENDGLHFILLLRRIKNVVDKHRLEIQMMKNT